MVGKTISHYKVLEKIGEGGMGVVYRATDTKLNRDVALKILPQQFASDIQRMGRFQREAQVLASLSHANIGHIYGIEDAGATKALVLELIEGQHWQTRSPRVQFLLRKHSRLPFKLQREWRMPTRRGSSTAT